MDDEKIAQQLHERWGPLAADFRARRVPNPKVKEQILRDILRMPRGQVSGGSEGRGRGLLLIGAAAAVVTAIVGTLIAVVARPSEPAHAYVATPPTLNLQPDRAGPATTLLNQVAAAAEAVNRPGEGNVEYLHTESWDLNSRVGDRQVTSAVVPTDKQIWRKPDDVVVTLDRYGPAWFPDETARRAWEAEGSPGSDTTPSRMELVGNYTQTQPPPLGQYSLFWADRPPRSHDQLQSWLRQNHNIIDSSGFFAAVVDLLKERVLTGPERAAVLRLLAELPAVQYTGTVTDQAGRPGEAFSVTSTAGGLPARHTLVIDRVSGRFLAYERTLTSTAGALKVRIPAVTSYVIFRDARFTTQSP